MYGGPTADAGCVKQQVDAERHLPIVADLVYYVGGDSKLFFQVPEQVRSNVGFALCKNLRPRNWTRMRETRSTGRLQMLIGQALRQLREKWSC